MALLLNIDTALGTASACLSTEEKVLLFVENNDQKDHASWLHTSIAAMLQQTGMKTTDLSAVSVSIGPGSYTGLRVGLSAAKGFCYALNIPLIAVGTLDMIAFAVKEEATEFICAMIDARRMEVFTALYDKNLRQIHAPSAMIIDTERFSTALDKNKVLFCGNGSKKLQGILSHPNASFSDTAMTSLHLSAIAYQLYREKQFADLAYTEPLYLKEFYSPDRKIAG
jgi:tRNA threonylcarbamoyladenosine biosynthesis protein TsaB